MTVSDPASPRLASAEGAPAGGSRAAAQALSVAADTIPFLAFLLVPLAVWPSLGERFTIAKWSLLQALAVAWFVIELWRPGGGRWPRFLGRHRVAVLGATVLVVLGSLRAGPAWAAPALLDRLCFVLLALAAYGHFRRNGGATGWIVAGAAAAASLVLGVGLAQVMGWQPLPSLLRGGEPRSAFFGNPNLVAQFVGLAVVFLVAGPPVAAFTRVRQSLAALGGTYLYFLSCRSVFVALGGALALLVAARRLSLASLARLVGGAAVGVVVLLHVGPLVRPGAPIRGAASESVRAEKALSTQWRLEVWRSTLELIRDHPLGVGAANFGDAFIPYQLAIDSIPGQSVLFRTPHNEYLRALAEEGVVVTGLAAWLLVALLKALSSSPRIRGERPELGALLAAGAVFLGLEALFQFPLGTAFGCLATAVLLGLALAAVEPPAGAPAGGPTRGPRSRALWRAAGTLATVAAAVGAGRVTASQLLLARPSRDAAALEAACRLDARNLPACVSAAWLRARDGQRREARTLLVEVVERSPYYHPAIRLLGEEAAAHGDGEAACLYLWVYDGLFRGRSAVHARLGALCGNGAPVGLPARFSMPHYRELPLTARDARLR